MATSDRSLFNDFNTQFNSLDAAFNTESSAKTATASAAASAHQQTSITSVARRVIPKLKEDMTNAENLLKSDDKEKGKRLINEMNTCIVRGRITEAKGKLGELRSLVERTFPNLVAEDKAKASEDTAKLKQQSDRNLFDDFALQFSSLDTVFTQDTASATNPNDVSKQVIPKLRQDMIKMLPMLKDNRTAGVKLIEEMNNFLMGGNISEAKEKFTALKTLVDKTFPQFASEDKSRETLPTGFGTAAAGAILDRTHIHVGEEMEKDRKGAFDVYGKADTAATALSTEAAKKKINNFILDLSDDMSLGEYEDALNNLGILFDEIENTKGIDYPKMITAIINKMKTAYKGEGAEGIVKTDILAAATEGTPSYNEITRIFFPTAEKFSSLDENFEAMIGSVEIVIKSGEQIDEEMLRTLLPAKLDDKVKTRLFNAAQGTPNSQVVAKVLYPEKASRPPAAIIEEQMRAHIANKENFADAQKALITGLRSHANLPHASLKPLIDLLLTKNPALKGDINTMKTPVFDAVRETPYQQVIDSLLWPNGVGKPREIVVEEILKKEVGGNRLDGALKELVSGLKTLQEGGEYEMVKESGEKEKQKQFKIIPQELLRRLINIIAQNEALMKNTKDLNNRIYTAIDSDSQLKDTGISKEVSKILWPHGKPADLAVLEKIRAGDATTAFLFFGLSLKEIASQPDTEFLKIMNMVIDKSADKEKAKGKMLEKFLTSPDKDRVLRLLWQGDPIQLASDLFKKRGDFLTTFQTIYDHLLSRVTGSMDDKKRAIWERNKSESAYFLISLREFLWGKTLPPGLEKGTKFEKSSTAASVSPSDNKDVKK